MADAELFTEKGLIYTGTDISPTAVARAKAQHPDLHFLQADTRKLEQHFAPASFEAIYARLSLHYFNDEETADIFRQLHLLLTPGGKLAFACRSIRDPECIAAMKDGRTLPGAEHMYEIGGLTRHYFTEALIRRLCEGKFRIELLDEVTRMPYGKPAVFYRVVASKCA